jgi:flavodoxin I
MEKIGLFYSFNSNKTRQIAEKIAAEFAENEVVKINAEILTEQEFLSFKNYILGVPTWFDGELPNYWDEFVPALEDLDLSGKTVALFGLGDQKNYPENFSDALGTLARLLEKCGARLIGETSVEGYDFESSIAMQGNKFVGLVLDQENQPRLTSERVKKWVVNLKAVFK